jgi:Mn2+/Fe2+ NRAMP family transporter
MMTKHGLAGTLKKYYSKPVLYLMLLFSFPAIVMNISADIAGMGAVGSLLFPSVHPSFFCVLFTFDKNFISILVAILGTTILPYLFFWQATMEVEDQKNVKSKLVLDKRVIGDMRKDVNFGMLFSNVVMFFMILTTESVLFNGGIHKIDTVEQAAQA